MASHLPARASGDRRDRTVKAVLGPTNTGKTHLAIERLCAHSSGAIGFPLRLLAREVYDRVCKIKGESNVALITGEEHRTAERALAPLHGRGDAQQAGPCLRGAG